MALARLLPASGLISVGVRPGMRVVEELKVKEGDQVAKGAVLAVLEGRSAARHQHEPGEGAEGTLLRPAESGAAGIGPQVGGDLEKNRLGEAAGRSTSSSAAPCKARSGTTPRWRSTRSSSRRSRPTSTSSCSRPRSRPAGSSSEAGSGDRSPETEILGAQIALAQAGLRETEVRAPARGGCLHIVAHPGELSPGTLLEMGDVSSMVATAEVYQSDVPRIRVGDPAEVDILGNRVAGKVTRIGSIVGRNQLTSVDPRALRDLRVVEVTIQLDRPCPGVAIREHGGRGHDPPLGDAPTSARRTPRRRPSPR